jgi:hypothetical protein
MMREVNDLENLGIVDLFSFFSSVFSLVFNIPLGGRQNLALLDI